MKCIEKIYFTNYSIHYTKTYRVHIFKLYILENDFKKELMFLKADIENSKKEKKRQII